MSDDPTPDELQQYNQTWDDMRGGNPFDATQHNPNKAGFGIKAFEAGQEKITPSPFDHNQGTPNEPPIAMPGTDTYDGGNNMGPDYAEGPPPKKKDARPAPPANYAEMARRANEDVTRRQQKLTSSDSFTHAWDYLLKGL